ncbi:hypothetical protein [Acidomonas methanolica]|uniref:Lipoprotein n=1 Tax=Acidomonas methanolica NBRC 104435 TaxID=1231351 RepID=A0A023D7U3_ACIMT|nr:hypothetical protein [Acidomonas methanolica]MBU2653446.1 hypothetical protein [Acidomonas methanolica]TCS32398.1 hypothetical protein EDC31_101338 [Acidomonas methanolica]GAJ30227.1 hypothetical protein Amme_112_015 [Acidomonas methanolica NBRC 104435]GBQ52370.1 hypothetical protein AA0498_1734 [Acidomonas methanolica]GEK97835.1 hypothetical protein AME01nite_03340 [Acidomonas methanolica NBRC 104435]
MQPARCFPILAALFPLLSTPLLSAGQAATRHHAHGAGGASRAQPVILAEHPGTELDARARELSADDLADAKAHHDMPTVLIASAPLSATRGDIALFVQLQSARLCGSAGCSTSVYLRHDTQWKTVLDSVSGRISILPTSHKGMRDLLISDNDKWIWNGSSYQDTMPAAPIGDLRQSIEAHQKRADANDRKPGRKPD